MKKGYKKKFIISVIILAIALILASFSMYSRFGRLGLIEQDCSFFDFAIKYRTIILGLFVFFSLVLFSIYSYLRMCQYRQKDIESRKFADDKRMIEALAIDYDACYIVNMDTGEFVSARQNSTIMGEIGNYFDSDFKFSDCLEMYLKKYVHPEDQAMLKAECSQKRIREKLAKKDVDAVIFRCNICGAMRYREAKLVRVGKEDEDFCVVLAFMDVDEQVRKEKQREEDRRKGRDLKIMAGIGEDYESLVYVDFDTGETLILKNFDMDTNKEEGLSWEYEDRIKYFADMFVYEPDRDDFLNHVTKENIKKELALKSAYYVNYRLMDKGTIRFYQSKYARVYDSQGYGVVIGVNSVDDVIRKELEQKEQLRKHNEKIEEMLRNESIYRHAISANASAYFQANLSKDVLVSPIWEMIDGEQVDSSEMVGNPNSNYSELVKVFADKYVEESFRESFIEQLSKEHLLTQYEAGDLMPEFVCRVTTPQKGEQFRKYVHYLSKDENSDDVMSMCVAFDVSSNINQLDMLRSCIDLIYRESDTGMAVNGLLESMGLCYGADSMHIFEVSASHSLVSCTYAWYLNDNEDVKNTKDAISRLRYEDQEWIMNKLKQFGELNCDLFDIAISNDVNGLAYMEMLKASKLIAIPLQSDKKLAGYLAIVNPSHLTEDPIVAHGLTALIYAEILRRKDNEEEQIIMSGLSEGYEMVYFVDLDTGRYSDYAKSISYELNVRNRIVEGDNFFEVIDRNIEVVVCEDDRDMMKEIFAIDNLMEILEKNPVYRVNYRIIIDGKPKNYQMKIIHNPSDTGRGSMVVGIVDMDEAVKKEQRLMEELARAMEAAESANQAKSDFLSRMSHDIRTPINGIIGMTEIAGYNKDDPEKIEDCLKKIDNASHHLLELINEILDLSRIESGKATVRHTSFDVRTMCENCESIISGELIDRNINLNTDFGSFERTKFMGDELHLKQILLNILGNAVKFTPDGGTISFRLSEMYADEICGKILFEIEDTGYGMKQEYLDSIFESFSQEDDNARSDYQGYGLGMAITKKLVDLLGGKIKVESTLDVGSKFSVELTMDYDNSQPKENISEDVINLEGLHVLLAEDNELNAEIASVLLSRHGVTVDIEVNGKRALDRFIASEENEYDAILMDIMMPVMDGLAATEAIRNLDRVDAKTVPIIAMTANAFDEDKKKSFDVGMNAHVNKPVNPQLLKRVLASCTKRIYKEDKK